MNHPQRYSTRFTWLLGLIAAACAGPADDPVGDDISGEADCRQARCPDGWACAMKQVDGVAVPTCVSGRETDGPYDDGATSGTGSGGRRGESEGSSGTGGTGGTGGYDETGGTGGYDETGGTGGYDETGGTGGYDETGGYGSGSAATGGSGGTAGSGSAGSGGSDTGCALVSYEGVCLGDVLTYCGATGPVIVDCAAQNMVCAYDPEKSYFDCVQPPPTTTGCGYVSFEGECVGDTLEYCENDTVYTLDCAATGKTCSWNDEASLYDCL